MKKRPLSVTFVAGMAIGTGVFSFVTHASHFDPKRPFEHIMPCAISILAVVAGVYLYCGRNWARWLWLAWMAFHVVLSLFHPLHELVIHAVFLGLFAFLLFRPPAAGYFKGAGSGPAPTQNPDDADRKTETTTNT